MTSNPIRPVPPPRANRMTLAAVTKGRVAAPFRELLHGGDGVGKSTWASEAPSPIFLCAEDGVKHLDVARFPAPEQWQDALDAVATLTADPGPYQTLVVDTIDWLESLVFDKVCNDSGVRSIEEVGGGYGKGYIAALQEHRVLIAALERLQRTRGLHVLLLAHSAVKLFKNPEGDDFERYVLKFHDKSAALYREWCEGVYFANYETFAVKDKAKRVRGVSTGARLMYTERTAAYDAKNRYGLPSSLPLDWSEFVAAVAAARPADPKALAQEITRKAAQLGGEIEEKSRALVAGNPEDASLLARLNDRLNAKLAEQSAAKGE